MQKPTNIRETPGMRKTAVKRRLSVLALVVFLGGCAGALNLPSHHRPQSYTVNPGDTLYSIAWHYGLNYHEVARWNGINPPYRIYPGQRIRLYPGHEASKQSESGSAHSAPVEAQTPSEPDRNTHQAGTTTASPAPSDIQWHWPAAGQVRNSFGDKGVAGKGIVIRGELGEPVTAAAGGTVVYAGSALVGYGRLVIVKHNDKWLSAYGHNQRLLVHEGETVNAGEKIATMGRAPDGRAALYFEIREDGSPVNPLRFLSSRR